MRVLQALQKQVEETNSRAMRAEMALVEAQDRRCPDTAVSSPLAQVVLAAEPEQMNAHSGDVASEAGMDAGRYEDDSRVDDLIDQDTSVCSPTGATSADQVRKARESEWWRCTVTESYKRIC
jgi:hypothetical protein